MMQDWGYNERTFVEVHLCKAKIYYGATTDSNVKTSEELAEIDGLHFCKMI